jgi:hypothetical protein
MGFINNVPEVYADDEDSVTTVVAVVAMDMCAEMLELYE